MSRLSADARHLLSKAGRAHEPSAMDREAVLRSVLTKLSISPAAVSEFARPSPLAGAKAASKLSLGLIGKWLIGGVLLGSLAVGTLALVVPDRRDEGALSLSSPKLVVSVRPVANPSAAPVIVAREAVLPGSRIATEVEIRTPLPVSTTGSLSSEPSSSPRSSAFAGDAVAKREAPPATLDPVSGAAFAVDVGASALTPRGSGATESGAITQTDSDLLKEARALRQAQAALREGRAADALTLIREQDVQFATGVLQEERVAARLLARCALGQTAKVRAEVDRFLTEAARSPLAPRVRSACREP